MQALEDHRSPAEKRKKFSGLRKLAAIGLGLAVCSAGFWAAVTLNAGPAPEIATDEPPQFEMLKLGEMYVNLQPTKADDLSSEKLMRISVAVVYDPAALAQDNEENDIFLSDIGIRRQISAEAPLLQDSFVGFLREMTADELSGSAGLELVKSELLKRARLTVGHDGPNKVVISEMIIQ